MKIYSENNKIVTAYTLSCNDFIMPSMSMIMR